MARMFRMTKTGRKPGRGELAAPFLLWTRVFDPRDRVRDPVPQNPGPTKSMCAWREEMHRVLMARIFRMTETGRNRDAAKLPRPFFVVDAGLRPARPGQRPGPTRFRSHKIRSHKIRSHKITVRQARGHA